MGKEINKKTFFKILAATTSEMIVMALVLGAIGYGISCFGVCSHVFGFSVGGIIGVMLALFSIYKRVRRYLA
ncbi:MAG: hypothetical protein OXC30_05965 [Alphaproteobacteria bacterium]|nr:hypothetical protein [Alphaproteobacteria bacterium]